MLSLRPFHQLVADSNTAEQQTAIVADTAAPVETAQKPKNRRLTIAAVIVVIAVANIGAFVSLTWTQHAQIAATSPMVWLAFGILVPVILLCFAADYFSRQRQSSKPEEIERIGPYILKEKLGSGGMGDVFLAEHQLMKRQCAIKLIHPEQARDRRMRDNFEREAKATAQLTHWNTIEVYDYGTSEDGRFYYVMEFLEGVNLWEYVERYGPMDPSRVVYILKQLCDALYEADRSGLVHRDIKPSNIFLTKRGQSCDVAKLLDFGLVQSVTKDPIKIKNVNKKLLGSPSFMCPEQAVGLTPDCRGDLYSLGAVAYYLLTGRPPFVDENPIMLIVAHATTAVPSFEQIGADVAPDIAEVIMKCLSRDACDRYDSARDLLLALEQCESCTNWNWKSAEDWWGQNNPAGNNADSSGTATDPPMATLMMDSPAAAKSEPVIDHNEPTAVYATPQELELV